MDTDDLYAYIKLKDYKWVANKDGAATTAPGIETKLIMGAFSITTHSAPSIKVDFVDPKDDDEAGDPGYPDFTDLITEYTGSGGLTLGYKLNPVDLSLGVISQHDWSGVGTRQTRSSMRATPTILTPVRSRRARVNSHPTGTTTTPTHSSAPSSWTSATMPIWKHGSPTRTSTRPEGRTSASAPRLPSTWATSIRTSPLTPRSRRTATAYRSTSEQASSGTSRRTTTRATSRRTS